MEKICRVCNYKKELEKNFHKKKDNVDGYRNECKECIKDIQKKYKSNPNFIQKRKQYDKQRYEEKKIEILVRKKDYYKENKEQILEKKKQYYKTPEVIKRQKLWWYNYSRNNRDVIYRYRRNNPHMIAWRSILYSTLKRLGNIKSSCTIQLLGYSADDLKKHLTSKFTTGMNWENYGEWHIDHIIPVSTFKKDTPINIICDLNNLQPLWATTREIDGIIYQGNLNKSNII